MISGARQSFKLPRTEAGLRTLSGQMAAALGALEAAPKLSFRADLVAEEICSNLVKYGVASGTPDDVVFSLWREPDALTLVIEDQTVPFSPVWAPQIAPPEDIATAQPGGLGLSLVRQTASTLHYDSLPTGNRMVARFVP